MIRNAAIVAAFACLAAVGAAGASGSAGTKEIRFHGYVVDVPAFQIGRVPVTNGEWQQFIDDGGYHRDRWWSRAGWAHRSQANLTAPLFWNGDGTRTRFGYVEALYITQLMGLILIYMGYHSRLA